MLIQKAIDSVGARDFLEIGVETGKTIRNIVAYNRIGVDPQFMFDHKEAAGKGIKFFQETSDQYFGLHGEPIDGVIYVDGLHTYEQSLRDIINALSVMSDRSIILVDDCLPRNAGEAKPAESHAAAGGGSWCGDVWKSIVHLRTKSDSLHIFTVDNEAGLAVITVGKPEKKLNLNGINIQDADYEYYDKYSKTLLNIKSEDYYLGFLEGRRKRFEG